MARTIESPGVEINEIDLSLRANLPIGTNILVPGFADEGPTDQIIQVTSRSEFETIFGLPKTPAERYFYHTVTPLFDSPAKVSVYRLPYGTNKGEGFSSNYSALAYPAKGISISTEGAGASAKASVHEVALQPRSSDNTYFGAASASLSAFQVTTPDGTVAEAPALTLNDPSNKFVFRQYDGSNAGITVSNGSNAIPFGFATALSGGTDYTTNVKYFSGGFDKDSGFPLDTAEEVTLDFYRNTVLPSVSGAVVAFTAAGSVSGSNKAPFVQVTAADGDNLSLFYTAASSVKTKVLGGVTQTVTRLSGYPDGGAGFFGNTVNLDFNENSELEGSTYGQVLTTYNEQVSGNLFVLGKPIHFQLTEAQYNDIQQKKTFDWESSIATSATLSSFGELGKSAMIVLNKGQTSIDDKFQGFYVGAVDNTNLNPATNFDGILSVESVAQSANITSTYTTLPVQRLDFSLSSVSDNNTNTFGQVTDSISETMENVQSFDITDREFDDTISLGLFRLNRSNFSPDTIKLAAGLSEKYVGTFDYHRQVNNPNGGTPESFSLETREDGSPNIQIIVNEFLNHKNGSSYLDINGNPTTKIRLGSSKIDSNTSSLDDRITYFQQLSTEYGATTRTQATVLSGAVESAVTSDVLPADSLFALGSYQNSSNAKTKDLGAIPLKLNRLTDLAEDRDLFDIDLTVDGGLTTINAVSEYLERGGQGKYFDDTVSVSAIDGFYESNILDISDEAVAFRSDWKTVFDIFANFAEFRRKDHMFIADLPRHLFVQGKNFKTLDDENKNFSLNLMNPLRAMVSVTNTSYAATYANWGQVYDPVLDDQVWAPISGNIAKTMANSDSNFQPWFAPAGFTRGIITGVNDLAIYPKQSQRDQLYNRSINPIAFFPNEGFVTFGQKTLLKKPSAFDRINVRRLFLNLEKATRRTVKFFVFDPNTLLTRTRLVNTIQPIFDNAKNTEGLYDFLIVCDERNNTPEVIDQNELKVDIYLKPVRAAEFILVNFFATRTGVDFNELI